MRTSMRKVNWEKRSRWQCWPRSWLMRAKIRQRFRWAAEGSGWPPSASHSGHLSPRRQRNQRDQAGGSQCSTASAQLWRRSIDTYPQKEIKKKTLHLSLKELVLVWLLRFVVGRFN